MNSQIEKQIPKTLEDCFRKNPVVERLEELKKVIYYLGIIFLIVIIIIGSVNTWQSWELLNSMSDIAIYFSDAGSQGVLLVLSTAVTWCAYAVIEFVIWRLFIAILEAISAVVQNSTISTNLSTYTTFKNYTKED